jgi:hypothetical protein
VKLLTAFLIHGALFVGVPYYMEWQSGGVRNGHLALLLITWLGIAFKFLVGDLVSGDFDYLKHGYDLCLISMGGALSVLAVQLFLDHGTLPGVEKSTIAPLLVEISDKAAKRQMIFLVIVFLACCCATFLCASINRGIKVPGVKYKALKVSASFSIGAVTFICYLFLVLWKICPQC